MLYYIRALNGTVMNTLNKLASAQTNGTQATMHATEKFVDYCHIHSYVIIRYFASQMQLHIHRDVSYLSVSISISRVGVHFFISEHFDTSSPTKHNGEVLAVAAIQKNVMASAAKA